MESEFWKKCSSCKKPIAFGATYHVCNISTCQHKRRGFQFCSVSCWDAHVPVMRHKEAWALERVAPLSSDAAVLTPPKERKVYRQPPKASGSGGSRAATPAAKISKNLPQDTLVVVSKLKHFIKELSGMNTSADVTKELSDQIRVLCQAACRSAEADGRKTVMARDFK